MPPNGPKQRKEPAVSYSRSKSREWEHARLFSILLEGSLRFLTVEADLGSEDIPVCSPYCLRGPCCLSVGVRIQEILLEEVTLYENRSLLT